MTMKKPKVISGVIALLLLSFLLYATPTVKASVIQVPEDVPTIQLAINMAYPGDTILVSAGTYYEHIVVNKSVTLTGEDPSNTIIDGSGVGYVVYVKADNVVVSGFTIQNGERGVCIRYSTGVIIRYNTLSNNLVGVYLSGGSSNSQIINNTIISNDNYGIRVYASNSNLIEGNTIAYNYKGLSLSSYTRNNIVNQNTIIYNTYGIRMYNTFNNTIDDNTISYNKYGLYASSNSTQNALTNNVISANTYGIRFWHSGNNLFRFNTLSNNQYGFWVYGNLPSHYVLDIDTTNTVNGKPIYYLVNEVNLQIPSEVGYVAIINSSSITAKDLFLSNNYHGILIAYSKNCLIENVTLSYNVYGIKLYRSNMTIIRSTKISSNTDFGIRIYKSYDNILTNNNVSNNLRYGIYLYFSGNNTLTSNIIDGNKYNFGVDGKTLTDFIHDIDTTNTVNGKPIYYWVTVNNRQVPFDAGYFAAVNCTNITAKDLNFSNNEHGILLAYTNNSLVENIRALFNQIGIETIYSERNIIRGNDVLSSIWYGIYIYSSVNNTLTNNNMYNNTYNFGVYGTTLRHYLHNVDQTNLVDNKPIYYWINEKDRQVPFDAGYFAAVNSSRIYITGLNLTHNYQGILLAYTADSVIKNVNLTRNRFGIYLDYSNNNIIRFDTILKNGYRGIYLYNSNSNVIEGNIISYNEVGIKIHWQSQGNNVIGNNVSSNDIGIWFDSSSGNGIYYNNFIYNNKQAIQDLSSTNQWDDGNGYGNYWSDYSGEDLDGNGIGNTDLPHLGLDYYPLMAYHLIPPPYDINRDGKVDILDIATVAIAFGSYPGYTNWNPIADLSNDGKVNILDIAMVAVHYGEYFW